MQLNPNDDLNIFTGSIRHPVVHVIPYEGIGGVESAARSLSAGNHGSIEVHKCFIARRLDVEKGRYVHQGAYKSENNPLNYLYALIYLLNHQPDVVIVSLWRSCIIGVLVKLLRPSTKIVVFLHSARSSHVFDALCNRVAMFFAAEVWADSGATVAARGRPRAKRRTRVISFLTSKQPRPPIRQPKPTFIFWGRLHKQKGLDRALQLFAAVKRQLPCASYTIVGPDAGEAQRLDVLCRALGVDGSVRFSGARSPEEIRIAAAGHSFYLQTSRREGMAMAVVEAMQSGLVPVVTPVGEIARYCVDGQNSVVVSDDNAVAAARICRLVEDSEAYCAMSCAAWDTWHTHSLYRDDVLAACRDIVTRRT